MVGTVSKSGAEDIHVRTADGLTLYAAFRRGAPGGAQAGRPPVLMIPGLTRNSTDFEAIAGLLAAEGRDAYAITLRGRGRSDRDPDFRNYHPEQYRDDVLGFLDSRDIERAAFIGTSLGGIVTMLTAEAAPGRLSAAVINDVGPALAPEGIERIAGYVGAGDDKPDLDRFEDAVAAIRAINEVAFPDRDQAFWDAFARRTFRETPEGRWRLDYDPGVARALAELGPAPDLWGPFRSMADIPTLIIRGAISDLLTPPIIEEMCAARPGFDYVEVPRIGHAPMLDEPEAAAAILDFLAQPGR